MQSTHVIVAGAQKCGTSTLFQSMVAHPAIQHGIDPETGKGVKELDFFDQHWHRGFGWYSSHYAEDSDFTIDATPNYLCSTDVAPRVAKMFPEARWIVTLRDPVSRAISQYNHYMQMLEQSHEWDWQAPGRSFEENIDAELDCPFSDWYGLVGRGLYFDQLVHLTKYIARERLCVVIMEEWADDAARALDKIADFVGIDSEGFEFNTIHQRPYTIDDVPAKAIARLEDVFSRPNDALYGWLDRDIPAWKQASNLK